MNKKKRTDAQKASLDDVPESMRPGHTPYWPSKRDTAIEPMERTLAYMAKDGTIHAETGETWERPLSWEVFKQLLFAENLQLFTGPLQIWLDDWWDCITAEIEDEEPTKERKRELLESGRDSWNELNYSPTSGGVVSVSVSMYALDSTGKRFCWQKRHVVQSSAWAGAEPSGNLLSDLRQLFTLLGTGTVSTPGSCGAKSMYSLWREHPDGTMKRHHRPTSECLSDILEYAVGSIKDSWRPDEVFTHAYELDRTNGFAAECRRLPADTVRGPLVGRQARCLLGQSGTQDGGIACFTWFGHCAVRIAEPGLPPGDVAPFVVRTRVDTAEWVLANGQGSGELKAPTEPGVYDVWLWKEEADEIERRRTEENAPMEVLSVDKAWYWQDSTEQLAEWAERMDQFRRQGLDSYGKRVSDLVKVCIVSGIGRLGMAPFGYRVVTERGEGDTELLDNGVTGTPLYLRVRAADSGAPKHWHAYILAMQNLKTLKVYHEAYTANLEPIGVNVDGVQMLHDPRRAGMGVEREAAAIGDWKINDYADYFAMPAPGVLITPTKIKTPGITKGRQRLLLHGLDPSQDDGSKGIHKARDAFARQMHALSGRPSVEACERLRQWFRRVDTLGREERWKQFEEGGGWRRIQALEGKMRKGQA